jgi:sugar lactone lactonase YvrE
VWNPDAATVAGGNGIGLAANQLNYPYGIAVSPSGDVYVADTDNNRIQLWSVGATQGECNPSRTFSFSRAVTNMH